jgi:uncharacterized damage-inducible protein DinB
MTPAELLVDAFSRIREGAEEAVDGLSPEQLATRPAAHANSIGWLVWHLARVQDDHVAEVSGLEQVWTAKGWHERFGLPFEPADTGYGHDSDQVADVRGLSGEQLVGYLDGVHRQTVSFVQGLSAQDLDRVVDERWDPPVTLGVRLISVVNDDSQHVGQAAFVGGLVSER